MHTEKKRISGSNSREEGEKTIDVRGLGVVAPRGEQQRRQTVKTWMGMLLAALVGAGVAIIGINSLKVGDGATGGTLTGADGSSAPPSLTSSNLPPAKAASARIAAPRVALFRRSSVAVPAKHQPIVSRAVSTPVAAVADSEIALILRQAADHFDKGETADGLRLYRGAFAKAENRKDVNLSPQVVKLLSEDNVPLWRKRYINYLVKRGEGGKAFENQLSRGNAILLKGEQDKLLSAWAELSQAHGLAADETSRTRVYDILGPMLKRHVFSLRMSPLVQRYSVQAGDNLTKIARRFKTTPESIVRLSGLGSEVIQPRSSLRILGGTTRVFIDKSDYLLWVTLDDKLVFQARVGLGRDNTTPEGEFVVTVRQKDPTWFRPGSDPIDPGDPRNVLGTRWMGFRDTAQVSGIGIHGTEEADSIGKESSAGCIRMLKDDVEMVFDLVPRLTTVQISP